MAFDKKTWANNQAGGTPLDASGLNDLESRIDDIGVGIVDMGTNTNGTYVKFENGLMVCYGLMEDNADISSAYGALFRTATNITQYLPQSFESMPHIVLGGNHYSTIGGYVNDVRVNSFTWRPLRATTASITYRVSYIAIGTWK